MTSNYNNAPIRVFDCVLYNGEIDLLELRLHELSAEVDLFIIVESTHTFSGQAKTETLHDQWSRLRLFAHKIRYIILTDLLNAATGPWERETIQRNSCLRGLADVQPEDLIMLSDVDEIPRIEVIAKIRTNKIHHAFGLEQSFRYFYLDYCNIIGPESRLTWTVVFRPSLLKDHTPEQLRYAVRNRTIDCMIVENAGWHFSYLADEEGVQKKIQAFSHQEFNNHNFLHSIDIVALTQARADLFGRDGFVWDIVDKDNLPHFILSHPEKYAHKFVEAGSTHKSKSLRTLYNIRKWLNNVFLGKRTKIKEFNINPVIICPYVRSEDLKKVRDVFGLDEPRGARLPFFFWHDVEMIGPEAAFQHCWQIFPDQDVIIIHSDMSPMPDDHNNSWYEKLLAYAQRLPDAGAIACDLLFPVKTKNNNYAAQCAGGIITADGKIAHNGGLEHDYDGRYREIRHVEWVTFGGVYLRRMALDMCGNFDSRYKWAYVMDVDYSMEMRLRGWRLYQVPVNLLHEENGTTRPLLQQSEYQAKVAKNLELFYQKWSALLPLIQK